MGGLIDLLIEDAWNDIADSLSTDFTVYFDEPPSC